MYWGDAVQATAEGRDRGGGPHMWMGFSTPEPAVGSTSAYYQAHRASPAGFVPLNYMAYDDLVTGDRVDKSTDGLIYTKAGEYADDGTHFVVNGNIVVDQPTRQVLGLLRAPGVDDQHFGLSLAKGVTDAE